MEQPVESLECRFCFVSDTENVLQRGDDLFTMFSVGPLVPGHTMLLTNSHFSCVADADAALAATIEGVRQRLADAFLERFGAVTMFEHGRAGACVPPGFGHDHCYHAHLHFLPIDVDLISVVERDMRVSDFPGWVDYLDEYVDAPEPYLSMWSGDRFAVVRDPTDLPHHYLRTRIAGELGESLLGDWAAFPRDEVLDRTRTDPRFQFLKEMRLDAGS